MNEWLNQFFKEIEKEKYNDTVMPKMWTILDEVSEKTGFNEKEIIYLGLYGSQNYRMDTVDSNVDIECFVFPTKDDIILGKPFYSICIKTTFGTCHVKDIRAAFNELRKSSPNILEVLATPYALVNKEYFYSMKNICCHYINYFADLNIYRLMRGLEGLYRKYQKDMATSNKAFANCIRIFNMMTGVLVGDSYTSSLVPHNYRALHDLKASSNVDPKMREVFQCLINMRDVELVEFYKSMKPENREDILGTINFWESELMTKYIKLEF